MANEMKQALFELTSQDHVQVDSYEEAFYFALSHLKRYDAILGQQWLASHKPVISSETHEVYFK